MNILSWKKQDLEKPIGEIFIEQLERGISIRMNIQGTSMFPFIKKNDVVTVRPIKFKETKIGDIIAFRKNPSDSILTLHRMIKRKKESIVTKGDANWHGDFPLYSDDVLGKVIKIERRRKVKNLETNYSRLSGCLVSRLSWFLAVFRDVLVNPGLVIRKIFKNS